MRPLISLAVACLLASCSGVPVAPPQKVALGKKFVKVDKHPPVDANKHYPNLKSEYFVAEVVSNPRATTSPFGMVWVKTRGESRQAEVHLDTEVKMGDTVLLYYNEWTIGKPAVYPHPNDKSYAYGWNMGGCLTVMERLTDCELLSEKFFPVVTYVLPHEK